MANKEYSSITAFLILDILKEHSDQEKSIHVNEIINILSHQYAIEREKKAILRIISEINDFYRKEENKEELIKNKSINRKKYYYLDKRQFTTTELRILIDSIAASKSITKSYTNNLIKKLYKLTSNNIQGKLRKQIFVDDRIKCYNEEIHDNIDKINNAINNKKKISFIYFDYNTKKQQIPRKNGRRYIENPISMILYNEFYYLIVYTTKYKNFTQYRIDRMKDIIIENENSDKSYLDLPEYKNGFNTIKYINKVFNMYSGEAEKVGILFHNDLLNVVIDRLGKNIIMYKYKYDDNYFKAIFDAEISDGFIGWLMQFGSKVVVLEPIALRERIIDEVDKISEIYKKDFEKYH